MDRASTQRLDAKAPAAREQIQYVGSFEFDSIAENIEYRLFHAVGGRTNRKILDRREDSSSVHSADDTHLQQ
jgi:hypothetical protein